MAMSNPLTKMTTMTEGIPLTGTGTAHDLMMMIRITMAADPLMMIPLRMAKDRIMAEVLPRIPMRWTLVHSSLPCWDSSTLAIRTGHVRTCRETAPELTPGPRS
jgi:hypothetical protein